MMARACDRYGKPVSGFPFHVSKTVWWGERKIDVCSKGYDLCPRCNEELSLWLGNRASFSEKDGDTND